LDQEHFVLGAKEESSGGKETDSKSRREGEEVVVSERPRPFHHMWWPTKAWEDQVVKIQTWSLLALLSHFTYQL